MSDVETRIEHKIDLILKKLGVADPPPPPPLHDGDARRPADVLDLTPWKITVPKDDGVKEVKGSALRTFDDDHFFVDDTGTGVVFKVFHDEGTTQHSDNPRSELREMTDDGGDEIAWKAGSGTHTLTVEGQVNRLTKVKPHVVLAQIHAEDPDVTVFRLEGKKLWITKYNERNEHLVTDDFALRTRYTLKMEVHDGVVSYWYNGDKVDHTMSYDGPDNFFKAGNYLQSNHKSAPHESREEWSEVVIYRVSRKHTQQ